MKISLLHKDERKQWQILILLVLTGTIYSLASQVPEPQGESVIQSIGKWSWGALKLPRDWPMKPDWMHSGELSKVLVKLLTHLKVTVLHGGYW